MQAQKNKEYYFLLFASCNRSKIAYVSKQQ